MIAYIYVYIILVFFFPLLTYVGDLSLPVHNELASSLFYFYCVYPHLRTCLWILERAEERERNIDGRNINWLRTHSLQLGLNCNPGMGPDQELDPRPFGLRDDAPTNGATRPGPSLFLREVSKLFSP